MLMLSLKNIPFKNLKAHPVRTIILLLLTLAQALCVFCGMMTVYGIRQELSLAGALLGADLLVYPTAAVGRVDMNNLLMQGTPVEIYKDRSMLSRMESCDGIDAVSYQIYINDSASGTWIVGFEPDSDFAISPWLEEGSDYALPEGTVAVGSAIPVSGNNTVTLFQKEWPVGAHLEETGSELDSEVFAGMTALEKIISASREAGIEEYSAVHPRSDFSAALIRVKDKNQVESVTDWINVYVRKVTAVRSEATLTDTASGIQSTSRVIACMAFAAWLILLAALGITQSVMMRERQKELYVWHAAGASGGIINRVMLAEAGMIHLAGSAAGVLIGMALMFLSGNRILPPGAWSLTAVPVASAATVLITLLAGQLFTRFSVKRTMRSLNSQMLLSI